MQDFQRENQNTVSDTNITDTSYRESHTKEGKGHDYRENFVANGLLAVLWELEKMALQDIADQQFAGRIPSYLDFACGTGRITGHVSQLADESTGVDISPAMLSEAKTNVTNVNFVEGDLTADDFLVERTYDLITAFRFFPNAEPALRNQVMAAIVAHLKPDGLVVFNNHLNSTSLRHAIFFRLKRKLFGTRLGKGVSQTMTRDEVDDILKQHKLEIIKSYAIGHLPMTEKVYLWPRSLMLAIEKFFYRHVKSERYAQYVMYVCRRINQDS